MEKEGKVDLISVLISAIVIFVVYAVLANAGLSGYQEFPGNNTNASNTAGYANIIDVGANITKFNATTPQFICNVSTLNATTYNITNVTIHLNRTFDLDLDPYSANQTNFTYFNATVAANTVSSVIFNLSGVTLTEGTYSWRCVFGQNASPSNLINMSNVSIFTIDRTPPYIHNITNSSPSKINTSNRVTLIGNFSDNLTSMGHVSLFVNVSGLINNEVNTTTDAANGINANNESRINISYNIGANLTGQVLNFTLQFNDSVGNKNTTRSFIFEVEGDGTPPGPINLSNPITNFNTTATTLEFNFSSMDNNDTNYNCIINISLQSLTFVNITGLNVTSGVHHLNTSTALSNGTYSWNVSCTDGPGNKNTSVSNTFTVDQIPPLFDYYNFTNASNANLTRASSSLLIYQLGVNDSNSWKQNRTFFVYSNWTDNLTFVSMGLLQFYNGSKESGQEWQTVNSTPNGNSNYRAYDNNSWVNFSFTPSSGHNEFEGKNISFRIVANDTLGNTNTSYVKNFTIRINDTTRPTVTINGSIAVNGTNLSTTTLLASWFVNDNNRLTEINMSIDGNVNDANDCNFFVSRKADPGASTSADANRNKSFQTNPNSDAVCDLGNGSHFIRVTAQDGWGNVEVVSHNFTVQSGSVPALILRNLTNQPQTSNHTQPASNLITNSNNTNISSVNITSLIGIQFAGLDGAGASVANLTYVSSCNTSSTVTFFNDTTIYPFNESSCNTQAENRTLKVTVTDTSGNFNSTLFGFLVDNVGPVLTVASPRDGQSFAGLDNMSINVSGIDSHQAISSFGYYLDGNEPANYFTINISAVFGGAGLNVSQGLHRNLSGTHIIKLTANDTLGNIGNSSVITFTQVAPIDMLYVNKTIKVNNANASNISLFNQNGSLLEGSALINQTFELLIKYNLSKSINISLKINFNGSAANWNESANIVALIHNDTVSGQSGTLARHFRNNQTALPNITILINNSLANFIGNNSYFGKVTLNNFNITNISLGGRRELSYFQDHNDMNTRINITQCSATFEPTHQLGVAAGTFPCWNNTNNYSADIFVPHFSVIVFSDNVEAPSINITTPDSVNYTFAMFVPNITVSSDTKLCEYWINLSDTAAPDKFVMTKSGNVCTGQLHRLVDTSKGYNLTFNVTDLGDNVNTYSIFTFNISDNTSPSVTSAITSSPSTTSATVTLNANETVNVTVMYGTANGTLSSTAHATDFNISQTVSITSLSASTKYYYNTSVCDFDGNCDGNGTFSFTTSAAAAAASTTTSDSGGGGGGGGGAAPSAVSDSKAQVWSSIPAGTSFNLDVDKSTIAVTSVAVNDVKSELSNVELEVAALTENPASAEAAAKVFQYFRITKKNLKDADAESLKISFRVTKSWLSDNSLGSGDISLYRFADDKWNELTTTVTGTDSSYVVYEADTPGFSSFAIGTKSGVEVAEEAPEGEEVPVGEVPEEEVPSEPGEKPVPVQAPGKAPTAWIIAAIVVILGIILIVMYQKKKQQV